MLPCARSGAVVVAPFIFNQCVFKCLFIDFTFFLRVSFSLATITTAHYFAFKINGRSSRAQKKRPAIDREKDNS
jgi:hypothetical protein